MRELREAALCSLTMVSRRHADIFYSFSANGAGQGHIFASGHLFMLVLVIVAAVFTIAVCIGSMVGKFMLPFSVHIACEEGL